MWSSQELQMSTRPKRQTSASPRKLKRRKEVKEAPILFTSGRNRILKRRRTKRAVTPRLVTSALDLPEDYSNLTEADLITDQMVEQIKRKMRNYRKNPLHWVKHELGIPTTRWMNDKPPPNWKQRRGEKMPLWSIQREILKAVVKYRRVAVKSCHGPGKTFISAIVVLYLLYVHRCMVITTAPTGRQVRRLLWGEISNIYNNANSWRAGVKKAPLGGRLLQTSLELDPKWFAMGFSTDKQEANIPGFHAESVAVIMDEACGCEAIVFDLLETILTNEDCYVLLIGNPNDPMTEFKKCFDPGSEFHPITINAYDTPNVKHKKVIWASLPSPTWPKRMKRKWGEESPLYKAKVLGEFPHDTEDSIFRYGDIQRALDRELPEDEILAYGGDIARMGGDRIVYGRRYKSGKYREVLNFSRSRLPNSIGKMVEILKADNKLHGVKPLSNIDDIGMGGGVTDELMEQGYPVNGINVGERAKEDKKYWDEKETVELFNLKAYYYMQLADCFRRGVVDIDDEELAMELLATTIQHRKDGKIIMVEKDKIKKKLGRSPDKAEAMMLAFAEDYELESQDLIAFI